MSAVGTAIAPAPYDVERVRADFPILSQTITGHPLVYLDNAASAQRPYQVLEAIRRYYETSHANVHRGAHRLSVRATEAYEDARQTVADHIGADATEVVFVRGTTEGINLVAGSWGRAGVGPDDEIVLTKMEHHSNLVPWQLLAERSGATLRFVDVSVGGEQLLLEDYERLLSERTRLVAVTHVSNTLGVINPVREIARLAHEAGALCLVDGAQAAPHHELDMGALGCDFYAFSGHKMCGPTGIGVLWARRELLEEMEPYQGGGEMISSVALGRSTWAEVPHKFEAGTPNIAGAIGLAAAIRYLNGIGLDVLQTYETELISYALDRLGEIEGLRVYGPREKRAGVISFTYGDIHAHDLATILDRCGIAVRAGHHCNQALMAHLGVDATARASLYLYNTRADIDALSEGIHLAAQVFGESV
jgi:cysteine desulfurase/selenocysteine lyase